MSDKNQMQSDKNQMQLSVNQNSLVELQRLDKVISEVATRASKSSGFELALYKAEAIDQLTTALNDDVMKKIMVLCGKKIGFLTDKDSMPDKYKVSVIRDCVIEAVLTGLDVTGNHFNIIAGRMYTTKEGATHLLKNKTQGLQNHEITYPSIDINDGTAIVTTKIQWKLNGTTDSRIINFTVRVNKGMSADAIYGKTERKAKIWLYNHLTNNEVPDGEVGDAIPLDETLKNNPNSETKNTEERNTNVEEAEIVSEREPTDLEKRAINHIEKSTSKEDFDNRCKQVSGQGVDLKFVLSVANTSFK